jgi:hypothetical protein
VNTGPVVGTPEIVTTTFPVVACEGTDTTIAFPFAFQDNTGIEAPPIVTLLFPCVEPKFVPDTVTCVPTLPELGESAVALGNASMNCRQLAGGQPFLPFPLTPTYSPMIPLQYIKAE